MVLKNLFTGLQWRNNIENRRMDVDRGEERLRCMERVKWKHITICKIDSQWEYAVCLRKLKQWLCINPEGWDGERDGMEFKKEGIYVYLWLIHVEV